ncbi:MAG: glycosyltransferase [Bacteroidales bacterium]|nr:glycosyltransferase [Bacteroidales bacterium]
MNILVFTQHIFPIQTPRSIRSTELIQELARRGHSVTVYAVLGNYDYTEFENKYNIKLKNIPIHWELHPYSSDGINNRTLLDKALGRLLHKFEFPLFEFYYRIPEIIKKEENFDVLISIAAPHHIHWGCAKAKTEYPHKFPKTWIADCGDPFMKNGKTNDHLAYFEKYERLFCQECSYITVPIQQAIEAYYPEYKDKFRVIPQGFDFDLNNLVRKEVQNDIPTFAYAGMFYSDIRNPKLFLDYLCSIDKSFKFIVYTRYDNLIKEYKEKLGAKLEIRNSIPRKELIEELKTMDFLVNLKNENSPHQLPSKLIDYGIANRPILNITPTKPEFTIINEFLEGNYNNELHIPNMQDYHISAIANSFEELM